MFESIAVPIPRGFSGRRIAWRKPAAVIIALCAIVAIATGTVMVRSRAQGSYLTQPLARQDLIQTVTASGTVNPQNTIAVGTQVSGTISQIYVDFNSKVKQGEVLARLDPSALQAQLTQAQAALAQAQAQAAAAQASADGAQSGIGVAAATAASQSANAQAAEAGIATADANVLKSQSALSVAQQTVQRDRALLSQGYIAQSQYDTDQSNAVTALSDLKSAQAAVLQARAQASAGGSQAQASSLQTSQSAAQAAGSQDTAQAAVAAAQAAQAQVEQDQLNLQRSVITSPVDGTVIARNVSVGETVAASLQTPTLFSIAQDLKRMEVDINVGEPDIGSVKAGNGADFSVLAYPGEVFHGIVSQVRINPATVQNVITYTVITRVGNANGKLLPGMTANATIDVAKVANALVIPAQALSWRPAGNRPSRRLSGPASTSAVAQTATRAGSPWGQTMGGAGAPVSAGGTGLIFVERGGKPAPVPVRINLISGTQAAVTPLRGTLQVGDEIVIGDQTTAASQTSHSSSGTPSMGGGIGRALR